jgi:hypothetical protein
MATHLIWCRAWPWYLPTFPFDKFDDLDGTPLVLALRALAAEWDKEHHDRVAEHREKKRRAQIARENGSMSTGSWTRRPPRKPVDVVSPGTFDEVMLLADWVVRPHGIVKPRPPLDVLQPTERVFIYTGENGARTSAVVAALRERAPGLQPSMEGLGSGHAILRYGVTSTSDMDALNRVLVARAYQDFMEGKMPLESWARPVVEEAARIDQLLISLERSEGEQAKPTVSKRAPSEGEIRAAESYTWIASKRPDLVSASERNFKGVYRALKDYVEVGDSPHYESLDELPTFETWQRYARAGLNAPSEPESPSEGDRELGSTVVRQEDL